MNTKQLRKRHRSIFTHIVEKTIQNKTVKVRVKNSDYTPFKQWVRNLSDEALKFYGCETLVGKAAKIRGI